MKRRAFTDPRIQLRGFGNREFHLFGLTIINVLA
jgi:hypothetical protein